MKSELSINEHFGLYPCPSGGIPGHGISWAFLVKEENGGKIYKSIRNSIVNSILLALLEERRVEITLDDSLCPMKLQDRGAWSEAQPRWTLSRGALPNAPMYI